MAVVAVKSKKREKEADHIIMWYEEKKTADADIIMWFEKCKKYSERNKREKIFTGVR